MTGSVPAAILRGALRAHLRMTLVYAARYLAPHPIGNPAKVLGDDVPVALGLEIVFL